MFCSSNRRSNTKTVFTKKIRHDEIVETRSNVDMFRRLFSGQKLPCLGYIRYHTCGMQLTVLFSHKLPRYVFQHFFLFLVKVTTMFIRKLSGICALTVIFLYKFSGICFSTIFSAVGQSYRGICM